MVLLKATAMVVKYGGNTILDHLDFAIPEDRLIAILGPSGSGKSTLLHAVSGFRKADKGTVTFEGADLYADFDKIKNQLGFVPQDDIVPRALKVERVLYYAAALRLPDLDAETRKGRIAGVMRILGLTEHAKKRVRNLSGGQRKRVSIATELLAKPRVIFADEPGSGLDPALERTLTEELRRLTDDGRSIVVTTHILSSLDLYDIVAVLTGGKLVYYGPPSKIKGHFGVEDSAQIYGQLAPEKIPRWHSAFASSPMKDWASGKTPMPEMTRDP